MSIEINELGAGDVSAWWAMRVDLWPDSARDDQSALLAEYTGSGTLAGLPHVILLARFGADSKPIGMAEVSVRPFASGCSTSPVGYLEGWFVDEAHRGTGVGRALVKAAERWAAARGCTEFASDVELDNVASLRAHERLGFEDVGAVRCLRKSIC